MNREATAQIIRESLDRVFDDLHGQDVGDTDWTRKIKTELCDDGNLQNLYTCASSVDNAANGEWLYDVCWLRYDWAQDNDLDLDCLQEAVLIVECEWAQNWEDIRDDFQKLLVGRARVRCMIWEENWNARGEATIAMGLANMVQCYSYSTPDDFYLLARYSPEGFRYWHLLGNGCLIEIP